MQPSRRRDPGLECKFPGVCGLQDQSVMHTFVSTRVSRPRMVNFFASNCNVLCNSHQILWESVYQDGKGGVGVESLVLPDNMLLKLAAMFNFGGS